MFIMKITKKCVQVGVAVFFAALTSEVFAGFGDPWWLLYKVTDSQFIYRKGPYDSQFSCEGDRLSLSMNQQFISCVQ
jgi:hypothetical protein